MITIRGVAFLPTYIIIKKKKKRIEQREREKKTTTHCWTGKRTVCVRDIILFLFSLRSFGRAVVVCACACVEFGIWFMDKRKSSGLEDSRYSPLEWSALYLDKNPIVTCWWLVPTPSCCNRKSNLVLPGKCWCTQGGEEQRREWESQVVCLFRVLVIIIIIFFFNNYNIFFSKFILACNVVRQLCLFVALKYVGVLYRELPLLVIIYDVFFPIIISLFL